ncbi:MAG TPA: arylamine N-acetyltransferase [Solirubrobacteraceae bacterium]|nr:arylamine N-acetyltransferase [Solirubrobacteraceae bacterium]
MFDLNSYLARIGLRGDPSFAELHRAHVAGILFENLDPLVGIPVSLDPEAIARKFVDGGRGGYCFEHNLLFKRVLEERGAKVEPILARVRNGQPATTVGPLTHLLLRVEYEGAIWHADVGFGQGTLLEPIPFGPGGPYEQYGWSYRVAAEGDLLVLQTATDDGWRDLYAFRPEPVPAIDIELSNWFTCTHPQSRFVTRLLVTEHAPDGTRTTLSDFSGEMVMSVQTPAGSKREPVARADVTTVLERRFGLREPELPDE